MKIHILLTGLATKGTLSGSDQLVLDLVEHIPQEVDIIVITPDFAISYWNPLKRKNLKVIAIPTNVFDFSPNPIWIFCSYCIRAVQVYRILRKEQKIDVLYSSSDIAYADIWPAYFIMGRNRRIKWISRTFHVLLKPGIRSGNYFKNFFAYYLQKLSYRLMKKRSQYILALNEKLKKELLDLGFPENRIYILGAGINYEQIKSYVPNKKHTYNVVALGRIAPEKGIFDAVQIWKKVIEHNQSYRLVWIGGGNKNYWNELHRHIKKENLQDSFNLPGFIDKNEIYNILKSANIFICTDHENGWGLAVCEAMSCGLPVASYNIDIFGEVYKKGFLSAPLFDTDTFAKNIITLLENDALRKKMGIQAFDQVSQFSHEKIAKKFMSIVEKI